MRWIKIILTLILLSLTVTSVASAYSVAPGKWEVYMYEDYEIKPQTRLSITIDNYHNVSIGIRLSVFTNPDTLKEGYELLPSDGFEWVKFDETEFTVPAKTKYRVPVVIDVENTSENYNRSWQFYIKCEQYAGGADGGGGAVFRYNYNLLWTIRTPKRYIPISDRNGGGMEGTLPFFFITAVLLVAVFGWHVVRKKKNEKKKTSVDDNNSSF